MALNALFMQGSWWEDEIMYVARLPVLTVIALLLGASESSARAPQAECVYDETTMLALEPEAFDEGPSGWRLLGQDQPGCEAIAAEVMARYLAVHHATIPDHWRRRISWHHGQLSAASGNYETAASSFRASVPEDADPVRRFYAEATIAFVERDFDRLHSAREQLAAVPKPEGFDAAVADFQQRYGRPPPVWPLNLDVVDGLIACFDRPYGEAYAVECRPRTP